MPDDDDLYERGRAIFERLRTATPPREEDPTPDEEREAAAADEHVDLDDRPSWFPIPTDAADGVDEATVEEPGPFLPAPADEPRAETPPVEEAPPAAPAPAADAPAPLPAPPPQDDAPLVEQEDAAVASEAVWVTEPTLGMGPPAPPAPDVSVETPEPAVEDEPAPREDLTTRSPTHFRRPVPRVLAVANQKGGVGKTTTSVNLGAALAELGYRVLVIDLDPQGNATTGLGVNPRNLDASMYDVILNDLPIEDCIEPSAVRNLFVAPASLDLAGAEIELVPAFSRELRLKRALEAIEGDYDFTFIDCPPSLGLLTVNGLTAATELLVPIQCEYYALEGLSQLLRNVGLVQKNLNPALELSVIVLVMYDARTKLSDQVVQEVRAHFGDKVCRNVIPRTVRLSEAPSFGQPIIAFDPSSRGAIAYRELAKEVSGGAP